jgi:acetyl esterase/lipase
LGLVLTVNRVSQKMTVTIKRTSFVGLALWLQLAFTAVACAQLSEAAKSAVLISNNYEVLPNITYGIASNQELKLDIYRPTDAKVSTPVVMMIHGGGWVRHQKEEEVLSLLPYLEMGWAAVNVEYRLARVALAPAAVEDCRCALHWIGRNAKKYNFDVSKIVVTGASAGGHLALATAMIPESAGFDNRCASEDDPKWSGPWPDVTPHVAAVINWVGLTDVAEALHGPNIRSWAVSWFGSQPDRDELAKRLSPINYVRAGLPAILTIHGDGDPIAPYSQAVRFHEALTKAGVRNQLLTVRSNTHGDFTDEQMLNAYRVIREFLLESNIGPVHGQ